MLDDIGGESQSSWVRDEVLGPILQHRLLDEKPTFFSSNITRNDLPMYMVENKQKAELMKAYRIFARIESLSEEFNM
jgi:primosomal protein DnaI